MGVHTSAGNLGMFCETPQTDQHVKTIRDRGVAMFPLSHWDRIQDWRMNRKISGTMD
jgi:hypothetical protein